ncbi:retropepsin-like domain-containing protein [Bacillus sp. FJAT-49711]|uniref:retropepsin-like aspartic protease n=1 Tax=Bacillus sp. FJAT-49711 TaxID=2833585 RepID=UPI001BCA5748|nr:retropepsin-like aspartic protease [Bacillus sp. FJAT-49711]MBS4220538.1 retropepsin-like domain-containing protein [Bacillus sp. FJAT-49711]
MKFEMVDHLPLVSVEIEYFGKAKTFSNMLLDTGCSSTILDIDLCEDIGLMLDLENAITRKMYGIGGTEICIEQKVRGMTIDKFQLNDFTIQLGDVREMHGFDGIIGNDFFLANKIIIDFEIMELLNN